MAPRRRARCFTGAMQTAGTAEVIAQSLGAPRAEALTLLCGRFRLSHRQPAAPGGARSVQQPGCAEGTLLTGLGRCLALSSRLVSICGINQWPSRQRTNNLLSPRGSVPFQPAGRHTHRGPHLPETRSKSSTSHRPCCRSSWSCSNAHLHQLDSSSSQAAARAAETGSSLAMERR